MKKLFLFLFVLSAVSYLPSCEENKDYPLARVEIYYSGTKVSNMEVFTAASYIFSAKFFNTKSQEVQAPHPENILWTANGVSASSASFTPNTGVTTSYVMTDASAVNQFGEITVEYENLNAYTVKLKFR